MSGGAVLRQTYRLINERLPARVREAVLPALESGSPGPLDFLYDAGADARLPSNRILNRAAAVFINFCAVNLSDDLSDGDCDYLPEPERIGPCVQAILQVFFFDLLARAHLPPSLISLITERLISAGESQLVDLQTQRWTASSTRHVGSGVAGGQWSAYLEIMWFGTPLAAKAATIGMDLGICAYVAEDIRSRDRRYATLPKADQLRIVKWAWRSVEALHKEGLACLEVALRGIDPVLQNALNSMR
jgi:hypothetical protein